LKPPIATLVFSREKDVNSATGQWFAELVQKDPWYKDVVDNVRNPDVSFPAQVNV
jgi:hypothetical protein